METADQMLSAYYKILQEKFGEQIKNYLFPPPVFVAMKGELLELDLENGSLTARYPILESYRNPYGTMQGGMIAAALDNTLGPLSVVIAPPNVTRTLEIKYSKPARPEMGYIVVQGEIIRTKRPTTVLYR